MRDFPRRMFISIASAIAFLVCEIAFLPRRLTELITCVPYQPDAKTSLELDRVAFTTTDSSALSAFFAFVKRMLERPGYSFASGFRIDPGRVAA